MELKYTAVFIAGVLLAVATVILCVFYKSKDKSDGAVKLANTDLLLLDEYYKKQIILYSILRGVLIFAICVMICATAILLARPYYYKKIKEQKYNRDIIICLDISSSVDELNLKLVKELQDTVRGLSGERIGIVIFNTTPVVLSPLTDDYEYTINQLENIRTAIRSNTGKMSFHGSDWLYWNEYLYGGTLIGNEIRGSSLIGDGLMGGLFAFTEGDNDRTKIIIFATDNDPNGEGYVNLTEAAEYCKKNNATVYGIGTKLMYKKDLEEMKDAVELTGGKFFLEEKASTFHEIVDEIETKSENLTEGKTIYKMVESPNRFYIVLVISFVIFVVISILLRRANVLWGISSFAMAVLLVLVYVYAVVPAYQFSRGPDLQIKRKSNLNVVFALDNTISMLAGDMKDGTTRLENVKSDVCRIVDDLDGAQFSVISFNNDAMIMAPMSQDTSHVKNAVLSMYPIEGLYAKGSSLDTPKELLLQTIKNSKRSDNEKTAVFFVSDGEITSDEGTLTSYAELSSYIDGGAVLGYGTKSGGTMLVKNYDDEWVELEDTSDWPYKPAVSVLDEKNLKTIASDLGVEYINMTDGSLDSVLRDLKSKITVEEVEKKDNSDEYVYPPKYFGFWFLIPFAVLVMLNAVYAIRKR